MSPRGQPHPPSGEDQVFITYLDQSDSFALGVEFGEYLSAMGQGYDTIEGFFSTRLEGQMLVAASKLGYAREAWDARSDGSCYGRFSRVVPS
jgi:uncharacterized protein YfiM (DUF2279 family)